jgi:signal transduction histidine kinase
VAERWWRRGSVRTRTTLLSAAVSGGALLLGAVLLLQSLDRSLHAAGDDLARGRVDELAALTRTGALPRTLSGIGGEGVGQVFGSDGTVMAASPNIVGRPPITAAAASPAPGVRVLRDAPDDADRESYRVWTARVSTRHGPVTVVAGFSLESVGEAARTLRRDLVVGVPLLVLLVAAGTWVVIGRTLRPVEDIRAEVAAISEDDLDRRVPVPATGDEVSRLATTMNSMLDRLQEGSRRQRTFVADASHELQSPLTALRSQLEVALAQRDDDWETTARSLLADTDEMERLVRDLLYLARVQEGGDPPRSALLDLDDVVLEEVTRLRATTDVRIVTAEVSAAPVHGDGDALRRLVRNLLENAVRHAGSLVRVRLGSGAGAVRLEVADDGAGVAAADRERVFDRFFAAPGARTRGTRSGLGLAIARELAIRHGGTLRVTEGDLPGAHFVFVLPS